MLKCDNKLSMNCIHNIINDNSVSILFLSNYIFFRMSTSRRIGRGVENRKINSKNLPTILSRKRKSSDDDDQYLQPVSRKKKLNTFFFVLIQITIFICLFLQDIQSFLNVLPKSSNSENLRSSAPLSSIQINRPSR